ncbi:hypothetical protein QAD02_006333 [Eretmocerus hayati]|uniref:Uncharacterized protein n=1 Tax=Eretmocerus hayati TaxID=131215 RepID=A0ACC2N0Y5_9HYME|nr:hypothetical protein QAD02_006333 [Eretmocerus hayati]
MNVSYYQIPTLQRISQQNLKGIEDGAAIAVVIFGELIDISNPYSVKRVKVEIYTEQRLIVETLLRHGADINCRNNEDESVLHIISNQQVGGGCTERKDLAELFLENGAYIDARDEKGSTPLHIAVGNTMEKIWTSSLIQLFLDYSADINATCLKQWTPLHTAVSKFSYKKSQQKEIFSLLLDYPGIDINVQNDAGDTPLHFAARILANNLYDYYDPDPTNILIQKCFRTEKLLLAGADVSLLNSDGHLPMHPLFKWLKETPRTNRFYVDLFTFVITHMKKLIKINSTISDKVVDKVISLSQLDLEKSIAIDIAIDEELNKLKSKMIDKYTSLFEILMKSASGVSKHLKNDEFWQLMTSSPDLRIDFPIYHDILSQKFKKGLARSLVLEPAKEALGTVLRVSLPHVCTEHILEYLSNETLENLVRSLSPKKSCKRSREHSLPFDEPQPKTPRFE